MNEKAKFNQPTNLGSEKGQSSKEEIWAVEGEIEEILDSESGHPLAGVLPANHPRWQKLLAEGLDDKTPLKRKKEILQTILKAVYKIKNPDFKIKFYIEGKNEKEKEIIANLEKNRRQILQDLKISENDPSGFLGNGSTSEVYIITNMREFCIKIIKNRQSYNELDYSGQRIHRLLEKEGDILKMLNKFSHSEVRTPEPYYYISTPQFEGLAMERLNAVNLTRVIEGHETLPPNFDLDDFFQRLKNYFQALHKKGIIHGDVAIRNLMVDQVTAWPLVIDFGKARTKEELWGTEKDFDQIAQNEIEILNNLKAEVKEKLKN